MARAMARASIMKDDAIKEAKIRINALYPHSETLKVEVLENTYNVPGDGDDEDWELDESEVVWSWED